MNHSPEPWKVDQTNAVVDSNGEYICDSIVGNDEPDDPGGMDPENTRRIVACVNFCREFPTDWLEKHQAVYLMGEAKWQTLADIPGFLGLIAVIGKEDSPIHAPCPNKSVQNCLHCTKYP
jgi:hypothetical protein